MLRCALNCLKYPINVYDGVSPSLLATMSLSADIKGTNMAELTLSLKKAGLISSQTELAAWQAVDRALFSKSKYCYMNRPCPISKGENMTDVFTHAVVVNSLAGHWRNDMSILDVGTGHGYLPFLIANILRNKGLKNYNIKGIDIYPQNIAQCLTLQQERFSNDSGVSFEATDLESFLETDQNRYDVIIGGFYMDEGMSDWLMGRLKQDGAGVWSTRSQHGQALYKLQPNRDKAYLIQTLFSMPVVRTSVSQYFIEKDDDIEQEQASNPQQINSKPEQVARVRKQMEQKLKDELKVLLEKHRSSSGKLLTLAEMKDVPEIKAKLDELQQLPKTKIKVPK